jgi:L-aminopeptidase/D-esterase-like protein
VGYFTDTLRPTGCTAILFDRAATAGVDYDGSAPALIKESYFSPSARLIRSTACCLREVGLLVCAR